MDFHTHAFPDRFGTDFPWADQAQALDSIRALPLTDDERRLIFHENAARLLGRA